MTRMNSLSDDVVPSRRPGRRLPMRLLVLGLAGTALGMLALGTLVVLGLAWVWGSDCLLYTSPSPRDS